jgi:uncharacterized protein YbaR (Trm112 family)
MSKIQHETGSQGTLVCPVCRRPLGMTVKRRHKTLGIFVPVWGPEPCRNPDCRKYAEEREHSSPRKR